MESGVNILIQQPNTRSLNIEIDQTSLTEQHVTDTSTACIANNTPM